MILLTLLACGGDAGTWMFTLEYTQPVGDECVVTPTHNYLAAYTPPPAAEDLSWSQTTTEEYSSQVFFGRVEDTDTGPVLIVGDTVFVDASGGQGEGWAFAWTNSTTGQEAYTHVTGYVFSHDYEDATTRRISGSVKGGSFTGSWDVETTSIDAWVESDTWSDEAAAYVGTGGLTPVGQYLLKLDGTGVEVQASNTQGAYDCSSGNCTLTVQEGCGYSYTLTGVRTDLSPDDASWADDAGQPAGAL